MAELLSAKATEDSGGQGQKERVPELVKVPLGDSDTETEPATGLMRPPPPREPPTMLKPKATDSEDTLRKRRSMGDVSGYISTDSEWEKVSENSEKDR